ncbi:MAG TPA: hypothetical protein VEW47_06335 [Candidatus Dormibacteraeota bacterium]|nr:hypothetical protein [Candidatus Dormibacteraeota bacterium]
MIKIWSRLDLFTVTSRKVLSRSTGRRILLLLLGACCLPAGLLRAQVQDGAAPTRGDFKFSVGVGGGYTTNPALRSDSGGSNGDSITDLRAGLADHKSSQRTDWSANYDAFYTRYGSNNQFDTINHALHFDGRYLVTRRTHLNLFEHFFYSRNPLQIGAAPTDETIILTRQTHRWRSVSDAGFDTSVSRSLVLQVGGSSRLERLDLTPSVDVNTYSGRLGIQKQVGLRDSVSSTYGYSRFDFLSESTADAEAHRVDVSWSHGPPAGAGYVLSTGVSRVTREGDSRNWLMAAATLHHPFRRFDFVSGYRRSLDADAGVATVTVAQNAYAGISGTVGRSASLGVFGEYGTRDSVLESGDRTALTYTGGAIRGSVTLDPRFSISGEARRRKQTAAEGSGEDLTVDTLFLGLVFQVF